MKSQIEILERFKWVSGTSKSNGSVAGWVSKRSHSLEKCCGDCGANRQGRKPERL